MRVSTQEIHASFISALDLTQLYTGFIFQRSQLLLVVLSILQLKMNHPK